MHGCVYVCTCAGACVCFSGCEFGCVCWCVCESACVVHVCVRGRVLARSRVYLGACVCACVVTCVCISGLVWFRVLARVCVCG